MLVFIIGLCLYLRLAICLPYFTCNSIIALLSFLYRANVNIHAAKVTRDQALADVLGLPVCIKSWLALAMQVLWRKDKYVDY